MGETKKEREKRERGPTWVSMAVVSKRLSMPKAGLSRSRQNSSISSNKMIVRSSAWCSETTQHSTGASHKGRGYGRAGTLM